MRIDNHKFEYQKMLFIRQKKLCSFDVTQGSVLLNEEREPYFEPNNHKLASF